MKTMRTIEIHAAALALGALVLSGAAAPARGQDAQEREQKIAAAMPSEAPAQPAHPRKLLVFSLCQGFKHGSIPTVETALRIMGEKTGAFAPVFSRDMAVFEPESLASFDAVLLNNTTDLKFENPRQRRALLEFVRGGKGLAGIHAATDNFKKWPEAAAMIGGIFDGHPWTAGGTWAVKLDEPGHPLDRAFAGKAFLIKDEIYQFKAPYSREHLRVLLSLDMSHPANRAVRGIKRSDGDFAISWIKRCGRGRVFYCSLGHNHEVCWNPAVLRHYLAGIQYALGDLHVDDTPSAALDHRPQPARTTSPGGMDDLFAPIEDYEFGKDRKALARLEAEIRGASVQRRLEIEHDLLGVLAARTTTFAGKQFVCRRLRAIGSAACVAPLAEMLRDAQLADTARFALERLPCAEVDQALLAALEELPEDRQAGIISSLGRRRVQRAAPAIAARLASRYPGLARAALSALGQIGGAEVVRILGAADVPADLAALRDDALLSCARDLARAGEGRRALDLLRPLSTPEHGLPVRVAAWRAMLQLLGARAVPSIAALLRSDEPALQRVAASAIAPLGPRTDCEPLWAELPTFPAGVQPLLLAALAARGDKEAAPAVVSCARSDDGTIRAAALAALGSLGGAEHVILLARAAAGEGEPARAAAASLERVGGAGVAAAFRDAMQSLRGSELAALARAAVRRRLAGLVPQLLTLGKNADAQVRRAAFDGLGAIGTAGEVPAMLALLAPLGAKDDLETMKKALRSTCRRLDDEDRAAALLIEGLEGAGEPARKVLLQLLGDFPSDAARAALIATLEGGDGALRSAALKSFITLAGAYDDKAASQRRAAFEKARALVRTSAEKRDLAKAVTSKVAEPWVVAFLEPLRADPECAPQIDKALIAFSARLARRVKCDACGCKVTLAMPAHAKYRAGGPGGLTDGKWGSKNHTDGRWMGFEGEDLDATLDLGREIEVHSIRVGFLENHHSWIFLPLDVEFLASADGVNFTSVARTSFAEPTKERPKDIHDAYVELEGCRARYLRVHARSVGVCPPWHGGGGKAFLFADEIQVNPHF